MGWPNQQSHPSSMTPVHPVHSFHYQSPPSNSYPTVYNTIQGPQRVAPKSTRPLPVPSTTVKPNAEATTSHDLLEPDRSSIRPEKLTKTKEAVTDFRVFQAQQRPDHTFNFRQLYPVIQLPWFPIQENDDAEPQVVASAVGRTTATETGAPNVIDLGDIATGTNR